MTGRLGSRVVAAWAVGCLGAGLVVWSVTGAGPGTVPAGRAGPGPPTAPSSAAPARAGAAGTPVLPGLPSPSSARRTTPSRLDIPGIDLSTSLVRLGMEEDRTVEVPTDPDRAGWFEPGTAPGAVGSSVVLGHVDSLAGPAVFARLGELARGDVVRVVRADRSVLTFEVLGHELYRHDEFPALRVYAASGARRLNLVTCGGEYDAARGGYQANLVVYTRLVRDR